MAPKWRRTAFLAAAGLAYLGYRALRERSKADLSGQVALVTGGSRGLGLLLAREFALQGCRLVICARDAQELARAQEGLERLGAEVLAVTCDLTERDQAEAMVARALERFGRIDVLVNSAGIIQVGPLDTMTVEDFESSMASNFMGAVYTTLAVLPQMRERGEGRITNITSIGGRVPAPHLLPYDAAKFAFRGFSHGLRAELAREGIVVTTIVPGLMRTGSPVNAMFKGHQAAEFTWFSIADSLPWLSIDAEQAARCIVDATRRGDVELTLTGRARLLGMVHDLFPAFTLKVLDLGNRLLPGPAEHSRLMRGMELATRFAPSWLTRLTNEAALRYNEFGGVHHPSERHARQVGLADEPYRALEPELGRSRE
ncbi:MAG TPA: SDR family oxidoreductase [Stenomitos sp.]